MNECNAIKNSMQPIDLIEIYACGTTKDLILKKENIKRSNIIKQFKSI